MEKALAHCMIIFASLQVEMLTFDFQLGTRLSLFPHLFTVPAFYYWIPTPSRSSTRRSRCAELPGPRCSFPTRAGARDNGMRQRSTRCPQRRARRSDRALRGRRRHRRGDEGRPRGTRRCSGSFPPGGSRNPRPQGHLGVVVRSQQPHGSSRSPLQTCPAEEDPGPHNRYSRARERRRVRFPPCPRSSGADAPHTQRRGPAPRLAFAPASEPPPRPRPTQARGRPRPLPLARRAGRGRGDPRKGRGRRPRRAHALSPLTATCRAT